MFPAVWAAGRVAPAPWQVKDAKGETPSRGCIADRRGAAPLGLRSGIIGGMSNPMPRAARRSIAQWQEQPAHLRLELIDGEFVPKALPDFPHASAQFVLSSLLLPEFYRRGGGGHPGGWWLGGEIDLQLGVNGFRPDLVGWRRERVPEMPKGRPVTIRPDWICEALSQSNASNDTIVKMWHYHQAGIPHYWILDSETKSLAVYRDSPEGYVNVMVAHAGESVRAEPFQALEIRVGLMFDEDLDD